MIYSNPPLRIGLTLYRRNDADKKHKVEITDFATRPSGLLWCVGGQWLSLSEVYQEFQFEN